MAWLYDKPPSWAAEMIDYIERQAVHEEMLYNSELASLKSGPDQDWAFVLKSPTTSDQQKVSLS